MEKDIFYKIVNHLKIKCLKKYFFIKKLDKLMKYENIKVREYCEKIDWENTAKWLHFSKATFKAFRRVQKLKKHTTTGIK